MRQQLLDADAIGEGLIYHKAPLSQRKLVSKLSAAGFALYPTRCVRVRALRPEACSKGRSHVPGPVPKGGVMCQGVPCQRGAGPQAESLRGLDTRPPSQADPPSVMFLTRTDAPRGRSITARGRARC